MNGQPLLALLLAILVPGTAGAAIVTLTNGVRLEGRIGKVASLVEDPLRPPTPTGNVVVSKILLIDDDLRRTFVPTGQVSTTPEESDPNSLERIRLEKRVAKSGRRVATVGNIVKITPFDQWGNRVFTLDSNVGRLDVVQGITEITPVYTRVEGLQVKNPIVWDMRLNTNSIPRDVLTSVMMSQLDPKNPDDRLRVVRLYIQCQRFQDALTELRGAIRDFPQLADLQKQVDRLQELSAAHLLKEAQLRRDAGQYRLAYQMLQGFPEKGIAGEIRLQVRELLAEYEKFGAQRQRVIDLLRQHQAALPDESTRKAIQPLLDEMAAEVNVHNLPRFADYLRLADTDTLKVDQKLSLAISGWLLGSGEGIEGLAAALSLSEVRGAVRDYLVSTLQADRERLLNRLQRELYGATPSNVAKILAHMKPPQPPASQEGVPPGFFELTATGLSPNSSIRYAVQLPPEYDPYRRYPCVVTLHGEATTPPQQVAWWAGAYHEASGLFTGQAARHGYIVVAPYWAAKSQTQYQYSPQEHAAVFLSLRDACRRFAIDTDRVFLSGHSMGGDAAWDMGLAHPDLWAGVVPITATAGMYIPRYWQNGRGLPMYFVHGEYDSGKMAVNGPVLDRYFRSHGFDVVVVEYLGRGNEHFQDEVQRLFTWLGFQKRQFFRREFDTVSLRPWDNFFWWVDLDGFPPISIVLPLNWPTPQAASEGKRDAKAKEAPTEARVRDNNTLSVVSAATKVTVWLAPELVNFDERIGVSINRRSYDAPKPALDVMLEDVRRRGDRQHPFWARVDSE